MKNKLKSLMKNKIFIGSAAAVLVLTIVITTVLLLPGNTEQPPKEPESSQTDSTVMPPEIGTPETPSETEPPVSEETERVPSDISVDVGDGNQDVNTESGGKAETPVNPISEKEPEKPVDTDSGNSGGIVIGGNPPVEENYSCGVANHHCKNPDAHAWILNLELEGCETCGSHSCPSFYATDEWGGASVDFTKCPKYSEAIDPVKHCQDCGKKPGDGSNGTCAQFIRACNCPLCGEWVEANTCHTCK